VERQFTCATHDICIGKSTFEYGSENANLLWTSEADRTFLDRAKSFKRESRMSRERSEDAVTWNVFRHLEASGRLPAWIAAATGGAATSPQVHYWSFDALNGDTWAPLAQAREAFGETANRGSEPDLVISTDEAHIWVEAKFGSSNNTSPTDEDGAQRRYQGTGNGWYDKVVHSAFTDVAVRHQRYELLRLWLLGSWAAAQHGKRFELVNLVRHGLETDVPSFAGEHFNLAPERQVHRLTWESIYASIASAPDRSADDETLLSYMRNKTLGYGSNGRLQRAFALQ
jgi:hypothetical protein